MRGTRARFPLGPLRRHRGHEALTLSLLALLLSQTLLRHPRCPSRSTLRRARGSPLRLSPPAWPNGVEWRLKPARWRPHVHPLPPPQSHQFSANAVPPLPPPPLHPRSGPPSPRPRRTGAPGWSGSARSTPIAIRAIQCWQLSRPWTSARQPRPPTPPPLFPPLPHVHPPPLPSSPLLPFCRHPLVGRRGNFANRWHRGDRPPLS